MKEKLKNAFNALIYIAFYAWFFTFHNFIVIKFILGFFALMLGLTVVGGVIQFIRKGPQFLIDIKDIINDYLEENKRTKRSVITKLNYSRKRIDAIEKAHTYDNEDVYVDHYIPTTQEEINDLIPEDDILNDLQSAYDAVQEKEKEIMLENSNKRRTQLKNELIKLSFELQDIITKNTIDMNNYENLEDLYQNYEAAEAYEKVAKKIKAYPKEKKYTRFLRK